MYSRLSENEKAQVNKVYGALTPIQKIQQILCPVIHQNREGAREYIEQYQPGGLFFAYRKKDECRTIVNDAMKVSKIAPIANADLVNGAGSRMDGCTLFPWQMAQASANSEDLAYKTGIATAEEGRECGIHWTFGPIVDINRNINNSMMHTRSFGADIDRIIRLGKAFITGVEEQGLMAAAAKHFPGDGIDDRDSHICTSVNSLSEKEWFDSFGRIWKEVIDQGVMTIMIGHISLPWLDPATSYLGARPGTLSKKIQIDLLRDHLGFEGLVISDAIPMIGFASMASAAERVPRNVETGSDMVLWSQPERDIPAIEQALNSGLLSEKRLNDAVRNCLALKCRLGLFNDKTEQIPISESRRIKFQSWADEIGENSISILRNCDNVLPLELPEGARVLTATSSFENDTRGCVQQLDVVDDELRKRGYIVDHLENPDGPEIVPLLNKYDAVFVNVHVMPRYGTTRLVGKTSRLFWDAFWLEHPKVIFTSFGDPYKLYEMPYVPNYVNTYSNTPSSQRAVVKVWLGEIDALGNCPVSLPGFFEVGDKATYEEALEISEMQRFPKR